jgi:hypothetical protein
MLAWAGCRLTWSFSRVRGAGPPWRPVPAGRRQNPAAGVGVTVSSGVGPSRGLRLMCGGDGHVVRQPELADVAFRVSARRRRTIVVGGESRSKTDGSRPTPVGPADQDRSVLSRRAGRERGGCIAARTRTGICVTGWGHTLRVLIVLCDLDTKTLYWRHVTPERVNKADSAQW